MQIEDKAKLKEVLLEEKRSLQASLRMVNAALKRLSVEPVDARRIVTQLAEFFTETDIPAIEPAALLAGVE
jgi:hypothetical protein